MASSAELSSGAASSSARALHFKDVAHQFPLLLDQVTSGLETLNKFRLLLQKICRMRTDVETEVSKLTQLHISSGNTNLDSMLMLNSAIEGAMGVIEGASRIKMQEFRQVEELVIAPLNDYSRTTEDSLKNVKRAYQAATHRNKTRRDDLRKSLGHSLKMWQQLQSDKNSRKMQEKVYRQFQKHEKLVWEVNSEEKEFRDNTLVDWCELLENLEVKRINCLSSSLEAFRTAYFSSLDFTCILKDEFKADQLDHVVSSFQNMIEKWRGVYGEPPQEELSQLDSDLPCESIELVEGSKSWLAYGRTHEIKAKRVSRSLSPSTRASRNSKLENQKMLASHGMTTIETVEEVKEMMKAFADNTKEVGVAQWDYVSDNDQDLQLKSGDRVVILEKDDSGWWTGEIDGKTGFFPGNYVKLLPPPQLRTSDVSGIESLRTNLGSNRGRSKKQSLNLPEGAVRASSAPAHDRRRTKHKRSSRNSYNNSLDVLNMFSNQKELLVTLKNVSGVPLARNNEGLSFVTMSLRGAKGVLGPTEGWPKKYRTREPVWNAPKVVKLPLDHEVKDTFLAVSLLDDKETLARAEIKMGAETLGKDFSIKMDVLRSSGKSPKSRSGGSNQCMINLKITQHIPRKKYVFMIRHGESEWNLAQEKKQVVNMMKKVDHGLSNEGRMQAESLAGKILGAVEMKDSTEGDYLQKFIEADALYSSPLTRALQTGVIALQHHPAAANGTPIRVLTSARERRNFGGRDTQGKRRGEEIVKRVKTKNERLYENFAGVPDPVTEVNIDYNDATDEWWNKKKESDEEFNARLEHLMAHLMYTPEENIIVVTHSFLIRGVFQRYLSQKFAKENPQVYKDFTTNKLENCAVVGFELEEAKNVESLNQMVHIKNFTLILNSSLEKPL